MGQSMSDVPGTSPYVVLARTSHGRRRGVAPVQCSVVPPTPFAIHTGRFGELCVTPQVPEVVRGSSQLSCANAAPGSWENSAIDPRRPASNSTTRMPRRVSSCARVPPPAPEPMMTTTPSSL
jgi:hypothetical protein